MDINECLEKRFLIKTGSAPDLVQKELAEAAYDLEKSEKAFSDEDWKWAIIKAYYCMFHAARAVLFKIGLRETKHFAIGIVLEDLYKKGKIESNYVNNFNAALSSREDADYHYFYSKDIAKHNLEIAEEFLARMKKLIAKLKGGIK